MGLERVRAHLRQWYRDGDVLEFDVSSATVELAALALGVEAARIAKSLTFLVRNECVLLVAAGDGKVSGKKFKEVFKCKSKMLSPSMVKEWTGYAIGGVCPFAHDKPGLHVWLDISLRRFATVFPACGSANSIIELSCEDLFRFSNALGWVDVCVSWPEQGDCCQTKAENLR